MKNETINARNMRMDLFLIIWFAVSFELFSFCSRNNSFSLTFLHSFVNCFLFFLKFLFKITNERKLININMKIIVKKIEGEKKGLGLIDINWGSIEDWFVNSSYTVTFLHSWTLSDIRWKNVIVLGITEESDSPM